MAFIGTPLDTRNTFQSLVGKRFSGDGSETDFTLDVAPGSVLDIEVFVGNVRQDPNSAYTLSGTTLTFTGAPPSGTNNIYVVHQAKSVGTINPGANSVGVTQLNLSDGSSGQFIKTDGSGTISFATVDTSSATDSFTISGSTPTLTIGDAGAEDTKIVFDGNAQDYHIGLDDSADSLVIGKGSALGTTSHIVTDENGHVTKPLQPSFYANVTSNYNPGTDGNHNVQYATEVHDVNADYNTSNYTFTAPVTGKYLLISSVRGYDVDATWSLEHRIVTSNRAYYNNTTRGQQDQYISTIAVIADMDANDTSDILINANESAFQISGGTYSYFTGALLS